MDSVQSWQNHVAALVSVVKYPIYSNLESMKTFAQVIYHSFCRSEKKKCSYVTQGSMNFSPVSNMNGDKEFFLGCTCCYLCTPLFLNPSYIHNVDQEICLFLYNKIIEDYINNARQRFRPAEHTTIFFNVIWIMNKHKSFYV